MDFFIRLKKTFQYYRPLSDYIIVIFFMLLVYSFLKTWILSGNSVFVETYGFFLYKAAHFFTSLFGQGYIIDESVNSGRLIIKTQYMAIWQNMLILAGVVTLSAGYKRKTVYLIAGFFAIIVFNVTRIILLSYNIAVWNFCSSSALNTFLVLFLNLSLIFGLYLWYHNNHWLRSLFTVQLKISSTGLMLISSRIFWALLILVVFNFFINAKFFPFGSYLSFGILKASEYLLNLMGFAAHTTGVRFLEGPSARIFMGDACLGLNLMLTFGIVIAILNGSFFNKVWFISLGILIIYILNILRITFLYIHLVHNEGYYRLSIDYHDIYSYSVYIVVFIMWVIWINNFNKNRRITDGNQ